MRVDDGRLEICASKNPSRRAPLAFPRDLGRGDEASQMAKKEKLNHFFHSIDRVREERGRGSGV